MKNRSPILLLSLISFLLILSVGPAYAQSGQAQNPAAPAAVGNAFTYQGQLVKNGSPYTGACDFTFGLWDSATAGLQVGASQALSSVAVSGGVFTVKLNDAAQFGANPFDGSARYLEISVKCAGDASPTSLGRQGLTSTPYASYAVSAGNVSGVVPVANGGTGSATQNFVDLSTDQAVAGVKTFTSPPSFAPGFGEVNSVPFTLGVNTSLRVANLNADMLDGQHATAFQQHIQNVIVVAKSGGDATTIGAAIASIPTSGSGAPSALNPYLIWVGPGVYTEQVQMVSYVDIQGAGIGATKITSPGFQYAITGTVILASHSELRDLTVENTGGNTASTEIAVAIYGYGGGSSSAIRLTRLAIAASGVTNMDSFGVYINNASVILSQVEISASGGSSESDGIYNSGSSIVIRNSSINSSGSSSNGLYNYAYLTPALARIEQSQISGGTNSFHEYGATASIQVAGSQISGGAPYIYSGSIICLNSYNALFVALNPATCQ